MILSLPSDHSCRFVRFVVNHRRSIVHLRSHLLSNNAGGSVFICGVLLSILFVHGLQPSESLGFTRHRDMFTGCPHLAGRARSPHRAVFPGGRASTPSFWKRARENQNGNFTEVVQPRTNQSGVDWLQAQLPFGF